MTSKPLNELTLEELLKYEKKLTSAKPIAFAILVIVTLVCCYITYKNGISFYTFLPLICIVLYMGIKGNLVVFKDEIDRRSKK